MNRLAPIRPGRSPSTTTPYRIIGSPHSSSFGGFSGSVSANVTPDAVPHDPHPVVGHPHHVPPSGAVYTGSVHSFPVSHAPLIINSFKGK